MKVLQISKFYQPIMGGIEKVAWEIAEGLAQHGIQSNVLCSNQAPAMAHEWRPSGYEVVRAASWGQVLSTSIAPAMIPALGRLATQHDVIHLHMPDPMAALALWAVRPKVPVVVHWHSDVIRQRRAMLVYAPLQRWVLQRADAVIATSQAYADSSEPLRPWRSKVVVIPIGITDRWMAEESATAAALRCRFGGRRVVFALGRMAYYKGFDVLIRAAAFLPQDTVVVIAGQGELLEAHRAMVVEHGLQDKVHLVGHIDDRELHDYFQVCDIFCLSSTARSEAYGVALLEAMMMGKAVVATDICGSGVPWVNTHGVTGFNVPISQPQALAKVLTSVLDEEALRLRLGQAARGRYLDEFSAERMTRRVAELYREVRS